MTTTLALELLLAAIAGLAVHPYHVRCAPEQVAAMRAEVQRHPDYTTHGVLGLVRCTCSPSTCARPPLAGITPTPRTAR